MDETFADAIGRARAICKSEDPHARCATEGGQAPFAFGWYNYENVVKQVDVIEPYNIGDRKSTRLNSSHGYISYAVFCLKKKKNLRSRLSRPHLSSAAR